MKVTRFLLTASLISISGCMLLDAVLFPVKSSNSNNQASVNKTTSNLDELEKQVIKELNILRSNPAEYASKLEKLKTLYSDKMINYPNETAILTQEGIPAVDEAIKELKNTPKLSELTLANGLSLAAKDLVKDQENSERTGHNASDGSDPFVRMERYGQWEKTAGENIDYGNNQADRIVMSLLIDDGVPSRGHRKSLLKSDFQTVGVSTGKHQRYRYMTVITLSGGYKDK